MTSINPSQFNVASFQRLGISVANKQIPQKTIDFMLEGQEGDVDLGKAGLLMNASPVDPLAINAGAQSRTEAQLIGQQDKASDSVLPTSAEDLLTPNEEDETIEKEKQEKLDQLNKQILQG
ncbi:hypothetical protein [Thalassospira lucentensis]|uniref:hypothetical protein n=1 Tax=Thalassospira lucentensis TaxID=168935 RepID=UPI00399D5E0B